MTEFFLVLALVALPALGNFGGGLFAEFFPLPARAVSLALHAAAGIVLAVVGLELMGRAIEVEHAWLVVGTFVLGGVGYYYLEKGVGIVRRRFGGGAEGDSPWMIYLGVSVDLFSDGVLIGSGSTVALTFGLLLALAQMPADIPEGFAALAAMKRFEKRRTRRLWLSAAFAIPIVLGATLGYWLMRGQPDFVKFALISFTAGILTTVSVEEMVLTAHNSPGRYRAGEDPLEGVALVAGFGLFGLLSAYT
ncbi:peptidoglycan-binding protein [Sulfurifustis variabilis]|uniref:Peptidoglycan-binding protein n=1 Tax=Sulfurifustis variabilis TaxID=1675686 RepID=A0A1B4VFZ5_9GAMM|nr:ZIP family metal transporter [Sulfurifustis variabilis]BAU49697.1 peptidoglycan-binding protein [Sulfurifustis variabilis]